MAHLAAGNALFGDLKSSQPFFLMAGPNVIQSEEHIFAMCRELKRVTDELDVPFIFKSSFDKANRTSITSFRGPGIDDGLRILQAVKTTFDVPIVTDIHTEEQAEPVSAVADVMQIPAFLCRQTDLLLAAGRTGRVINIKKGQFCAPSVMRNSAKKVFSTGNENVLLCERGSTFGYSDLVVDMRNIPLMRDAGCPIVADVTHSLQQPAGLAGADGAVASGGSRELIPTIARSCVAAGVDGLFMEVHNDPNSSPVDGPTQWPLRHFPELLAELKAIALASKARTGHNAQLDLTPMNIM
jgi:2-dehydro-3-deoxyphosphooctonate aldolase (KDO 8-P synthase)